MPTSRIHEGSHVASHFDQQLGKHFEAWRWFNEATAVLTEFSWPPDNRFGEAMPRCGVTVRADSKSGAHLVWRGFFSAKYLKRGTPV